MSLGKNQAGFTKVPNALLDALAVVNLTSYEARCLYFLIRKIFGFHKESDRIALSQFARALNVDRRNAHRGLRGLRNKGIVISTYDKKICKYSIQINSSKWLMSSLKTTTLRGVIATDDDVSFKKTMSLSSSEKNTKERPKRNYEKERRTSLTAIKEVAEEKQIPRVILSEEDLAKRRALLKAQAEQLKNGGDGDRTE